MDLKLQKALLELLNEKISINQILQTLNIDRKIFLLGLKELLFNGYQIKREIFDDGEIELFLKKDTNFSPLEVKIDKDDKFRAIFISDLHLGRKKDRLDYIEQVYNYATKNGIGIIFNLGDLIENIYHLDSELLKHKSVEKQVEYVIRKFPFDKNITNIILYGNHDKHSIYDNGLDVGKVIENNRYDLISAGYTKGQVNFKNDKILLAHGFSWESKLFEDYWNAVIFKGHSHKMQVVEAENRKIIKVPALSNAYPDSYDYEPLIGFLDAMFILNSNGTYEKLFIKYYIFNHGMRLASETHLLTKK